jgi:mycothiol synthase
VAIRVCNPAVVSRSGDRDSIDLHAWQPDHPNVARDRIVQRFAMREIRRLDQMHADLPIPQIAPPRGISIRAFEPADTSNWIAVHNQIFATHPDASGWRPSDLSWRMAEHWFDPQGFRLALDEQGIAGYNWVKLHNHPGASHDPSDPQTSLVGEIYMLGVAERARSSGLSRAIATDGLAWAFSKGATRAMLYVEADNHPALALYRSLGFSRTHTDRCFEITVSTSVAPSQ